MRGPVIAVSTQAVFSRLPHKRVASDRWFYLAMALAAETVIFFGFSRTYYLKFHYPSSPSLSLIVHIHALVFTSWMIYFIVQTLLIAVRRPALHRSLGIFGAVLGTAVIGMGLLVAVIGMRLGHGNLTQSPAVIFLVALIDIGSFALFFILGYRKRRDREAHQRLMLLAVIIGLTGAGLGRLTALGVTIPVISAINFALLFAGPVYDLVTRRRIQTVYRWAIPYALATFTPLRFLVGATSWWNHLAHRIVGT
jgi:FtsH-binding integral membrane protein